MKKLLLGAGTCALTMAGVGAAVALNANTIVEADAAYDSTMTIFIGAYDGVNMHPTGENCANAGIHYWKNGGIDEKADIERIGNNLFYANVPTDIDYFQILRTNAGKTISKDSDSAIYNYSQDIPFNSGKTFVALTGWSGDKMTFEYNVNSGRKQVLAGERYYLDTRPNTIWSTASAVTAMKSYTEKFYGSYGQWLPSIRLGDMEGYYVNVTTPFICDGLIGMRLKPSSAGDYNADNGGLNDSNIWNQTTNITDLSKKHIVVENTHNYSYDNYDWNVYSTGENELCADIFSTYFLNKTEGYCDGSIPGSTSNLRDNYDSIEFAQSEFYEAEVVRGKGETYDNNRSEALSRYVNMQEEKDYGDFLGLEGNNPAKPAQSAFGLSMNNIASTGNNIAIVATLIGVSTAVVGGGFMFIARRRKAE